MRYRVITSFLILNFIIIGNKIQAQTTTLTDLLKYTLEHSRDIKKSDLQSQEADYLRKETLGKGLPQISLAGTYSRMFYNFNVPQTAYDLVENYVPENYQKMADGLLSKIDQINGINMASAGVQVTQLIYSQAYWTGLNAAKKAQELYAILRDKSEEDVFAEVATGYYQAGSLMLQLKTVNKSIDNLREIYRISELSYKNDLIKESQVNRLKVTISNLEVTSKSIQDGITIQINYLKALAGMPENNSVSVDTASILKDFVRNDLTSAFSVENVPAYKALLKQNEVFEQQIKLARATYLPVLAAFGKFNYSYYSLPPVYETGNKMTTIGLSLTMPIFTSGTNSAKVKQALLRQAQLKEDIEKTKDLLSVSYNNAFLEYQTASKMLDAQKENLSLAQKVYHQTELQFREGMSSMAELLNVNSDFLQADNSYNQQILKCKTAEIKMLKATGNLKSLIKQTDNNKN